MNESKANDILRKQKIFFMVLTAIILTLSLYLFAGQSKMLGQKTQLLSPEKTMALLKENEKYAIVIGKGKTPVYAFIDPLCEMSQDYLEVLYSNKGRILVNSRVYLFLYHLERKPSKKLIASILESNHPEAMLKQSMIEKQTCMEDQVSDSDVEEKVEAIASLAQKIGVYKRPYMIVDGIVISGGEQ